MTARHLPCERIRPFLRDRYDAASLKALREALRPATAVTLTRDGFLPAAQRPLEGGDPTNYDAVWVRDAVWGYLGLRSQAATATDAVRVLKGLVAYFGTEAQRKRLRDVIRNPETARNAMSVLHIRFDAKSPALDDVTSGGKPQTWNHKQNDALGLFYQAALDALAEGTLEARLLSDSQWEMLLRLPTYFDRIDFAGFEDAGAWEELERVNSSSVALVTSALERLAALLEDAEWHRRFLEAARRLGVNPEAESIFNGRLPSLVDTGYARLRRQLPFESPDYPKADPRYREADAALLAVLYPARLSRLGVAERAGVVETLAPLVGDVGIRRYVGDAYQAGNYWRKGPPAGETDARTDDCSGAEAFAARGAGMIPGTEAQWFFDSWLSIACGLLFRETGEAGWYDRQIRHFNRALGQLTGDTAGADGRPVPAFSFPESYNVLVDGTRHRYAPSPITPLNWAKCSMLLALRELEASLAR